MVRQPRDRALVRLVGRLRTWSRHLAVSRLSARRDHDLALSCSTCSPDQIKVTLAPIMWQDPQLVAQALPPRAAVLREPPIRSLGPSQR